MLHAVWQDGLVIFGWRSRVLDQRTVLSLASTLFAHEKAFSARPLHLEVPGRNGWLDVTGFNVSLANAADAFQVRDWVPWRSLSPSLAWFARAARLGREVATCGLVVPALIVSDGRASAGWQPVVTDAVGSELAFLANGMPPVVGSLSDGLEPWQLALTAVTAFADGTARLLLSDVALPDPAPGSRRSADVVARRFLGALSGRDNELVLRGPQDHAAAKDLAVAVDRWSASSTGRSPLTGLETVLRVVAPDDVDTSVPDDEAQWLVELLLAPSNDPSRLVLAADVWSGDGADLLELDHDDAIAAVQVVARRVSQFAPSLARGFSNATPASVTLGLDGLLQFLRGEAAQLERRGIRVLLPAWWGTTATARILGAARTPTEPDVVAAGLDVQSLAQVDWTLALDGEPLTDGEIAKLAAAKHELVYLRGKWVGFNEDRVRHALTALTRQRREKPVLTPLELLQVAADPEVEFDAEGWAAELLAGLPDDRMAQMSEPDGFVGTLRHYQQRGLGWLAFLHRLGLGGVLADDMGLGKTAQLLALIAHARGGPTLVICPLSVVRNWETETARFTPGLTTHVHHGPQRATTIDAFTGFDVVITTYAIAARDATLLSLMPWRRLVADEAQHVKNPQTGAAKALRRIPAKQKLALTGTPVENRLSELWSIMDLCNPGLLGNATSFRERFAVPIERHRNPEATAQLRRLIQPFLLRRSKADPTLVPELPPKVEQIAWATLTREQAGLYQSVVDVLLTRLDKMKSGGRGNSIDRRGAILAALTALKQICNHPVNYLQDDSRVDGRSGKLARFDELVTDVLDAEERLLVFTQYRRMGEVLVRHLRDRLGVEVPYLHGGVTKVKRDAMVDSFQSGTAGPILLVSLKAGGSGLNLTAASHVVHYDRWWNPAVENQASDRAWRIGQTRSVFVHKLVCQGTVEERIDQLIESKRDLAESVVGPGEGWITELSTDELRDLIALRDYRA